MIVKFIVTKDSQVIFGEKEAGTGEFHEDIQNNNNILYSDVTGGGRADLVAKHVFGTSYEFGDYNRRKMKKLLPGWRVDVPDSKKNSKKVKKMYRKKRYNRILKKICSLFKNKE